MFEYFTRQEFAAEPLYVRSVQDAIKNYEREQRDFENLKYNAAYMGRELEYCEECRLKHPPLRKNVVDEEQRLEQERKLEEMKRFEKQLIESVEIKPRDVKPTSYKTQYEI